MNNEVNDSRLLLKIQNEIINDMNTYKHKLNKNQKKK